MAVTSLGMTFHNYRMLIDNLFSGNTSLCLINGTWIHTFVNNGRILLNKRINVWIWDACACLTHSPVSCRGPCSAAVCSIGSGCGDAYWSHTPPSRGTCTPGSCGCFAWKSLCSLHSSLPHSDDLQDKHRENLHDSLKKHNLAISHSNQKAKKLLFTNHWDFLICVYLKHMKTMKY